jgi:hypothetical protein
MRFLSHSDSRKAGVNNHGEAIKDRAFVSYESEISLDSTVLPGVKFTIRKISFGRRMELSRQVREIVQKVEFLQAGHELRDRIEASILTHEVDAMYLRWGLVALEGLTIDDQAATIDQLVERGPEEVTREIISAIKKQCELSEGERKN